ncbi:putative serine/threonine-protein kinase drkB [Leucoagaricus sp. SymC.cos]|nr:putative serine/threonine-protein kinase drkB [Leucoagaricus sp. SymC.cos]
MKFTFSKYRKADKTIEPLAEETCLQVLSNVSPLLGRQEVRQIIKNSEAKDMHMMIEFLDKALRHPDFIGDKGKVTYLLCRMTAETKRFPQSYRLHSVKYSQSVVGEGGFAQVREGKWHGRTICLKLRRSTDTPVMGNQARIEKIFMKEFVMWAHFLHPNVLPFYGVILVKGEPASISPWMKHGNIRQYIQAHPVVSRLPFILDTLNGLAYLHKSGVVHGDIKGENVLISSDRRAVLTDFGLSKAATSTLAGFTQPGDSFSGRWSSPELISGQADDEKAVRPTAEGDIWSLACLIYEIMSRRLPYFQYGLVIQVMSAIKRKELPIRPKQTQKTEDTISDEIWRLLLLCWNFNPQERPTCRQVLEIFRKLDHKYQEAAESAEMRIAAEERLKTRVHLDFNQVRKFLNDVSAQLSVFEST